MADGRGGRPEPFSQNFQREVQAFLFCLQWRVISIAEFRTNLRKIGVELSDASLDLPKFPQLNFELPEEDDANVYPNPDASGDPIVSEDVLDFMAENNIDANMVASFPVEAFTSLNNFVKALNQNSEVK